MALDRGSTAPSFTLYSDSKEKVSFDFPRKRNTLLLFFPMAFSDPCTNELCSINDNLSVYENAEAQVYGISVDSPFSLEQFRKANDLSFPLLSDFNKEVSRSYEALYEDFAMDMRGVSKRAVYIVDKKGTIHYSEVLEDAGQMPNFDQINQTLAKLDT